MATTTQTTKTGGYIYLAATGAPTIRVPVETADQASEALSKYRDEFMLGASDFKRGCGEIRTNEGEVIAEVSYNGRVWTPDGKTLLQDIEGGLPARRN